MAKVSADVGRVLSLPESKQRLAEQGAEPAPNAPDAFTAFVNADIAKWLDLARKAGISELILRMILSENRFPLRDHALKYRSRICR